DVAARIDGAPQSRDERVRETPSRTEPTATIAGRQLGLVDELAPSCCEAPHHLYIQCSGFLDKILHCARDRELAVREWIVLELPAAVAEQHDLLEQWRTLQKGACRLHADVAGDRIERGVGHQDTAALEVAVPGRDAVTGQEDIEPPLLLSRLAIGLDVE